MEPHHAKELPYIQVFTVQCYSSASNSFLTYIDSNRKIETKKKGKRIYLNRSDLDIPLKTWHRKTSLMIKHT